MRHKVLLLGAGFSKNWGGLLAKDVSGFLASDKRFRDPTGENEELRKRLFESAQYENVLEWYQHADADAAGRLEDAIVDVFLRQDDLMRANLGAVDLRRFSEFLRECLTASDCRLDIFTLNQDLLWERHLAAQLFRPPEAVSLPGFANDHWKVPASVKFKPEEMSLQIPTDQATFNFDGTEEVRYVKLHGSLNWVDPKGRPVIIAGGNKEGATGAHPLLTAYKAYFAKRLLSGRVDLLVIGYSFGDENINRRIIDSIDKDDLRIFVIDPMDSSEWYRRRQLTFLTSMLGSTFAYWPWPLTDVFPPNALGSTAFADHICEAFLSSEA